MERNAHGYAVSIAAIIVAGCAGPTVAVDFHVHLKPEQGQDMGAARRALEAAGIERGCVLSPGYQRPAGCETAPCEEQRAFTRTANDEIIDGASATGGTLLPFCGVPLGAEWVAQEVTRCAARGARGIKLHPVSEGRSLKEPATSARFEAVLEAAAQADIPVIIHVAMKDEDEVRAFFALVAKVPRARVIAAHQIAPSFQLLPEAPKNLWIEISGLSRAPAAAGNAFVPVWRAFGIDRVLFGSDWPLLSPTAHLELLEKFPLEPAELAAILRGNAATVIRPPQPTNAPTTNVD